MKYYYAFWIPIQKEGEVRSLFLHHTKDLCDKRKIGGYWVEGEFDKSTYDITLSYQERGFFLVSRFRHEKKSLKFVCDRTNKVYNKFGFIIYSLELPDNENERDGFTKTFTDKEISPAIYNFVKEFFHTHKVHSKSNDSLLHAYVSKNPIDLTKNEQKRELLNFYLNQYDSKASDFIKQQTIELNTILDNINKVWRVRNSILDLGDILVKGNIYKGEMEFCDFLRNAWKKDHLVSKELADSLDEGREVVGKFLNNVNLKYTIASNGLGIKYGVFGIEVGVLGIIVSIFIGLFCGPDMDSVNKKIDGLMDSVKETVGDSLSKYNNRNDSILSESKKIREESKGLRDLGKQILKEVESNKKTSDSK